MCGEPATRSDLAQARSELLLARPARSKAGFCAQLCTGYSIQKNCAQKPAVHRILAMENSVGWHLSCFFSSPDSGTHQSGRLYRVPPIVRSYNLRLECQFTEPLLSREHTIFQVRFSNTYFSKFRFTAEYPADWSTEYYGRSVLLIQAKNCTVLP